MAEQTIKEGEPKMTLLEELKLLLEKDGRLVSEGKLLKNRIVELALKLDKDLIKLLLSNERIKTHFFTEVDKILVFDKEKFMKFVDNKEFLPDSYTAFKNKIGLNADKNYIAQSKEVVLSWPYKDCILEGGQEKTDEKRNEIFHNEILAPDEIDRLLEPKVFTNFKRIDAKREHKITEIKPTDNLIIKGNNLLVLHSLKKRFTGKVKLIYIDPPYNTGNDEFKYNDSFNHSTWLTFMKNRLEVAKELLREDGVIFVQIDNREMAYLKVLMDEVFDRQNFITTVTCKVKGPSGVASGSQFIFDTNEYILIYKKSLSAKLPTGYKVDKEIINQNSKTVENYYYILEKIDTKNRRKIKELQMSGGKIKIFKIPDKDFSVKNIPKKGRTQDVYIKKFDKIYRLTTLSGGTEKRVLEEIPDNGMYLYEYVPTKGKFKGKLVQNLILKKSAVSFLKDFGYIKKEGNKKIPIRSEYVTNSWMEGWWQGIAKEGSVKLKSGKKPEQLIQRILELGTEKGDLILDFFSGSGTTCAVAHKMGRQYIGVEQLDYGENSAVVRLKNVINGDKTGISKAVNWNDGGDFVYCELMELNEKFIQKIQEAKNTEELLKIWDEMKEHAFLSYKIEPKDIDENIEEFKDLSFEDQKRFLIEILDKNDLYVNYSEIEDNQYKISEEDKKLNKKFYGGEL